MKKNDGPYEIAYYSSLIQAWLNTSLEKDKTITTLSTAAIGLIVTLLTTVGPKDNNELYLYAGSLLFFIFSIFISIIIFGKNAKHIADIIKDGKPKNKVLMIFDKLLIFSFLLGLIFLLSIGVLSGLHQLKKLGDSQVKETKKIEIPIEKKENEEKVRSFAGIEQLLPVDNESLKKNSTQEKPVKIKKDNKTK